MERRIPSTAISEMLVFAMALIGGTYLSFIAFNQQPARHIADVPMRPQDGPVRAATQSTLFSTVGAGLAVIGGNIGPALLP